MRSWGRSARGGGAAARERAAGAGAAPAGPPGPLAPRFVSARVAGPRPRSRPALGRPRPLPPLGAQPFVLRVVTKHYKKAGRAVPGIRGGAPGAKYTRERGLRGGFDSHSPRRRRRHHSGPARSPPGPAPVAAPRLAPPHPPPPAGPGALRGQGRARRRSPRGRARGPAVDFAAANIWAQRGPPTAGRRALGTVGGAAPKPKASVPGPGRKEGRGVEQGAGGFADPGFSPVSLPFGSFPAGEGTR